MTSAIVSLQSYQNVVLISLLYLIVAIFVKYRDD